MSIVERYVTDERGRKTAVLIPIKRYERMIEDLHDLRVVAKRSKEKPIGVQEMRRRLEKDGVL